MHQGGAHKRSKDGISPARRSLLQDNYEENTVWRDRLSSFSDTFTPIQCATFPKNNKSFPCSSSRHGNALSQIVDFRQSSPVLDLPGHPILDKGALIGSCARLPLAVDGPRLHAEVAALPEDSWGTTAGRVGVHRAAAAIFLRGYAPAEGEKPIEDRPALERLPYAREIITRLVGGEPLRCLLARLPGGATIAPHVDRAPYFAKALRLHFPVETHNQSYMVCDGLTYRMQVGEAWALNNSTLHAVWNADDARARTHMICDFLPGPGLLELLARAERGLGRVDPAVDAHLFRHAGRPEATG